MNASPHSCLIGSLIFGRSPVFVPFEPGQFRRGAKVSDNGYNVFSKPNWVCDSNTIVPSVAGNKKAITVVMALPVIFKSFNILFYPLHISAIAGILPL